MKNVWKIVVIGIILGIALMIVGFITGARSGVSFGRGGVNLGEFPLRGMFSNVIGMGHNFHGDMEYLSLQESGERSAISLSDDITMININVASANIEFVTSNEYRAEIINRNNRAPILYAIENGVLTITQDTSVRRWLSFGFNAPSSITIFLPNEIDIESANLRTVSGRINIGSIVCRSGLIAGTVSGSITINNSSADFMNISAVSGNVRINNSTAHYMHISVVSGNIRADDIRTEGFTSDSISGSVTVSGELMGQTKIDTTSGSVRLTLQTMGERFQRDLSVLSGNINVNGERIRGRSFNDTERSENRVIVSTLSGNIHLDLE
ncbi:MAG: DUF4097 domain-containing protein [Defluviitaleaceae bacterium]|nr:DUF4097 domain-containing protein [Defluviitaleaceae bacterium]